MTAPTITFLPDAPDRGDGGTQFDFDSTAWAAALPVWTAEVNVVSAFCGDQAGAALAAAVAGNLSALDLLALKGLLLSINLAGTALEGVEIIPSTQATETEEGVAELATLAKSIAGTDDLAMMTALKVASAIAALSPISAKSYVSTGQTITSGGLVTLAHGLTVEPSIVTYTLQCTSADAGYSIGDRINCGFVSSDGGNAKLSMPRIDSTNIYIRFDSNTSVFNLQNKTSGAVGSLINSRWQLYVKAWA